MGKQRKVNNLLVTGGAGFIGSAFIRYVLNKVPSFNGKCVNLDLLTYAGNLANLREVENDPRYFFQKAPLRQVSEAEKHPAHLGQVCALHA